MKQFIRRFLKEHDDVIPYLVFGVCTTLINIVVYGGLYKILKVDNVPSTILAWLVSVLFAFITNKLFVFQSRSFSAKVLGWEIVSFFGCRIATGVFDVAIMYVTVDLFRRNAVLWKILSNVVVIVLNYVASKLVIFQKGSK